MEKSIITIEVKKNGTTLDAKNTSLSDLIETCYIIVNTINKKDHLLAKRVIRALADEFNVSIGKKNIEQLKALNKENQMKQQCNEEIIQKIRELVK